MPATTPDDIARAFHEAYERLAPEHSYTTRAASAVQWEHVPEGNKGLMVATVAALLEQGTISPGPPSEPAAEVYRMTRLWLWLTHGELRCGCHWQAPYGVVVMMGCRRHD